ncbi:MAG: glucosamine-6-phosphate deaminase [Thermobacillus sp. ZCTH02-B1]|uniref:glucosamine-6-phosphate deaminase n=1 Tax=Thermobacillus sp. ZCTH02-B1 TaxID=1858795 RepID=UPI000B5766A5|nr:glucosamine-6-phosphate deaminase [Thermobacillus sp. ZCTH02-B1]OUM93663.1 MAG: glucosamine-6-phosphate deaminase [Thermobacillus sp. ZCTH02-B1]
MKLTICETADELGLAAARECRNLLQEAIERQGEARIVLSTGASQFEFLSHFVKQDIEWDKVEMFHLDEYVGLPESHPASFRKYLKERFLQHVPVRKAWLISGEGDLERTLNLLNGAIREKPVDVGLIGIGENAHIAFNDPPADFEAEEPYRIVTLNDACKRQQVREGWFPSVDDVPPRAISMSVRQILRCRQIVSVVPRASKADAVYNTFMNPVDPKVPATILKTHRSWRLFLDKESAAKVYRWA